MQENQSEKEKEHFAEIEKALEEYKNNMVNPNDFKSEVSTTSRAFKEYKEDEANQKLAGTFFEKMCALSEKLFKIDLDKKSKDKIESAIDFTALKITPEGVAGLSVMALLFFLGIGLITIFLPAVIAPNLIKIIMFALGPISALYIFKYPQNKATSVRIKSSGELVMVVLYMIVYMKTTPNLEGAVRFAAQSATGKVGRDLKQMLWRLENGEIQTIDEGLMEYVVQWKNYNREFMDSIEFIRASMRETNPVRRENMLDKSVSIILEGTNEKMKHYSRDLQMPIMVIHGLGILLPIMGMIIFPLASIFLGDSIPYLVTYLIFGYDLLIPLVVYVVMKTILDRRPSTKTVVDISHHPDAMPINKMRIGKSIVPVWPFALISGGLIVFIGIFMLITFYNVDSTLITNPIHKLIVSNLFHSLIIIIGIAVGLIVYYWGTSFQKIKIIKDIQKIEEQFESALFALGNRLASGMPLELSLAKAHDDTKDLEISGLFRGTVKNMSQLNMTFHQALFDPKYGSLFYYPSKLIRTIMQSISEAVDKGTKATSMTMLIISEYLRNIRTTQEKIDDILSETSSSMKFQAFVLVPMISGVVVSTSQIIMTMMFNIDAKMKALDAASLAGTNPMGMMIDLESATQPWILQLLVGIYVIEILILLSMFVIKITDGDDKVKQNDLIWHVIIIGIIMYIIVLATVSLIFGGLISTAMGVM
ncbi:MAG: hypothetical protein GQ477_05045 [Nanohaloarchaea archaeon]|nr:hypothetical protein [Candidatus Nanohaloarchaea archaeon]